MKKPYFQTIPYNSVIFICLFTSVILFKTNRLYAIVRHLFYRCRKERTCSVRKTKIMELMFYKFNLIIRLERLVTLDMTDWGYNQ